MARVTGPILALDLGVMTGFAVGHPGQAPTSGTVRLKHPGERIYVAYGNLIAFLCDMIESTRPELVMKEKMLNLAAFGPLETAERTIRAHAAYHGIVEGVCHRYNVDCSEVSESTVRKHFVGTAKLGGRDKAKLAVVTRCHLLGLMPKTCADDNRGDALAVWDWTAANFGGNAASITNFQLFGQGETGHAGR